MFLNRTCTFVLWARFFRAQSGMQLKLHTRKIGQDEIKSVRACFFMVNHQNLLLFKLPSNLISMTTTQNGLNKVASRCLVTKWNFVTKLLQFFFLELLPKHKINQPLPSITQNFTQQEINDSYNVRCLFLT